MRERGNPSRRLLALAEAQHCVLSLEQAAMAGLGRHSVARLVDEGHWQRLSRGLVVVGPQTPSWMALAWGGILLGGPSARLAGEAAGYLHTLVPDEPGRIEVLVPHGMKLRARGCWVFPQERDGVRVRSVGHPPRTSAEDTLLDLCDRRASSEVINLVIAAVQSNAVSVAALERRLTCRGRVTHRRVVQQLLVEAADGIESVLELDFARRVERPHALPRRTRQQTNAVRHRRDVRYDDYATVVELDGRMRHQGMGRFRDMHRDNYAATRGEATLRFGFWDVHEQPCLVARQIAAVLRLRGWCGELVSCPNCRLVPLAEGQLP